MTDILKQLKKLSAKARTHLYGIGHDHFPSSDVEGSGIRQKDDGSMEKFCPAKEAQERNDRECQHCSIKKALESFDKLVRVAEAAKGYVDGINGHS